MAKFFNADLADLSHQLTLSPKRLRFSQVQGVEHLLGLIDPERAYPYEFVCFHITGYDKRSTGTSGLIPGKALISDLVGLAELITRKANVEVDELPDGFKTHEALAEHFKVSTKTIRRWRNRGLMGIWVQFADGVSRLAFLAETVSRFAKSNSELVSKGAAFRQLTEAERTQIIDRAREILYKRSEKLNVVARKIAEETGRAVETVRYTLRRYDRSGQGDPLFGGNNNGGLSAQHRAVWRCHKAGESAVDIAKAVECEPDEVVRIVHEMKLREWAQEPIEYVNNELFDAPNADQLILDVPEPEANDAPLPRAPKDLPSYLRSLYLVPLLTAEQERDLFRRYNYMKYKVVKAIRQIEPGVSDDEKFERIESAMDDVAAMRKRIVQANLRLVVSIAKKHVGWTSNFFDVISDGNISLLRAIEKFDYSMGNKFSTYATWAIVKNFARSIPESHYHYNRYVTGQEELLSAAADERPEPAFDSDRQRVRQILAEGMSVLSEREQDIITAHFGLANNGQVLTLEQLGDRYGVTKERVRQIERRALDRLREHISPSAADLLAG